MEKELYKSLIEDSPILLMAVGLDGKIMLANNAFLNAVCFSGDETASIGSLTSLIPETDHEALSKLFGMTAIGFAKQTVETGLITGSGRRMSVEWHGRAVRDSNDMTRAILCIGVDVTERRSSDEELLQTKEYLENVLENSPDAIGIVDSQGRFVQWNRMAEKLYGYTLEELRGNAAFVLYADQDKLKEMLARLRGEGSVRNYEIDMKRKDGAILPFDISLSLLRNKDRAVVGSVCVARNLSEIKTTLSALATANSELQKEAAERQRTWEALKKSQVEYSTIFENTGNATVIVEEDTTISLANAEFARLSGCSREEIEGKKSWTEFFVDENLTWMKEYHRLRRVDPNAAPRNYEASFRNSQGRFRDVYMTVAAVPNTNKSVISLLDITERKRAEERLRQSHIELEQRSYEISQLNEMLDLLQICHAREETYYIISHFLEKLFPSDSGFLGLFKEPRAIMDVALSWGGYTPGEETICYDDCWGLRQGKAHASAQSGGGVCCRHIHAAPSMNYLCVPLVAQGEVLGLFHLCFLSPDGVHSPEVLRRVMDSKQRLAVAVADHIALAMANLNLRETLRSQSIRDPLTGLFNRRFMEESLDREFHRAKRQGLAVAVFMMDIDHFKVYNDTYGHDAGDTLLSELGSLLKNHVRGEDVVCRYGGEEFVMILPAVSKSIALDRAESIRNQVKKIRLHYQNQELEPVSISLGVAFYDEHGTSPDAVLKAADMALYQAKNQGRDQVVMA
ncbi:MAG: PAS domain S-box protein [Syntrophobacteraceae bacterium]|nr:PAS domain S-box protein [Syntrophobacteraceae bacterium]